MWAPPWKPVPMNTSRSPARSKHSGKNSIASAFLSLESFTRRNRPRSRDRCVARRSLVGCGLARWIDASLEQIGIFQQRQPFLAYCRKFRPVLLRDGVGRRQAELFKVFILALLQNAEVQVRPGGQAGAADQAYGLANLDVFAGTHKHAGQMQIHGLV